MKHRWPWMGLGAMAILGAALLFLNFHAAVSNTQSERNISSVGLGEGLPQAMRCRERISLALVGEGQLVGALQEALVAQMHNAGIGDTDLVRGLEPASETPVLVVKVEEPDLLWTPFYAASRLSVQASYSSNGDNTLMGDTPVTVDNSNGPVLTMHAEYQVDDRSWGLISRPGYHQTLAAHVAHDIVATLKELYKVP